MSSESWEVLVSHEALLLALSFAWSLFLNFFPPSSHSFGYECTKRSNLHVLDENSVLFSAGNTVEILNLKTQEQTHIRTTGGGGIGAIAVSTIQSYM